VLRICVDMDEVMATPSLSTSAATTRPSDEDVTPVTWRQEAVEITPWIARSSSAPFLTRKTSSKIWPSCRGSRRAATALRPALKSSSPPRPWLFPTPRFQVRWLQRHFPSSRPRTTFSAATNPSSGPTI